MITVERIGPRSYLRGTSFLEKDASRAAGGHWDLNHRAWWLADDAQARDLAAKLTAVPARADDDRESPAFADRDTRANRSKIRGAGTVIAAASRKRSNLVRLSGTRGIRIRWADTLAPYVQRTC
jgi:hypothetical protein